MKRQQPKAAGRPEGSKNPSAHEKIKRNLPQIYEGLLKSAMAGDAAAAGLCFDIAKNPAKYPLPQKDENDGE